jgi:uncharacterized membrane protein
MGRSRVAVALTLGAVLVFVSSCSSSSTGGSGGGNACPQDLPSVCPSPAPSYKDTVAAIFASRCTRCHSPTGVEPSRDFTTYANVHAQRSAILDQVYACSMPPAGETPPTNDERTQLLAWLVCAAPDN